MPLITNCTYDESRLNRLTDYKPRKIHITRELVHKLLGSGDYWKVVLNEISLEQAVKNLKE